MDGQRFLEGIVVSEDERKAVGIVFKKDLERKGRDRGALKTKVVLRGNNKGETVTKGKGSKCEGLLHASSESDREEEEEHDEDAVSYTHLTLPTTPYV